ncbi:MAG TPA: glycosyltransferase family 4 protein [Pyrinomonadaceae bacterium]
MLFVIPEYPPHSGGGIVTFYRALLPELVRQGHYVRALVGSGFTSKLPSYEADGVEVDFLDHEAVSRNLSRFQSFRALPELQRHLSAAWTAREQAEAGEGYDLVETSDWGLLFAPWVTEKAGPPVVVQLHGSVGQIDFNDPRRGDELFGCVTRMLEMQVLPLADELQTYSTINAGEWGAITKREVTYIPPAWKSSSVGDYHDEKSKNGLVVGRVQYWKGPIVLCEALRLLGTSAPTIDWVGRDTDYVAIGSSMSTYLSQTYPDVWGVKVLPIGRCAPEEVAKRQARAAFSVVPSLWDVFNFTCVEEMGCGQVVVCSKGAGASELINDGEDGFVFPSNNAEELARKLKQLLLMTEKQQEEMGRAAQSVILSLLNPMTVAEQRIKRYESLVARGRSSSQVHPWISESVRPHGSLNQTLAFLDKLPLRELSGYALRRGVKRILN